MMTKEEYTDKLKGTVLWANSVALLFLIALILSPVTLLWFSFFTFIKLSLIFLFLCIGFFGVHKWLSWVAVRVANESYEKWVNKKKLKPTFEDKLKQKMEDATKHYPKT